MRSVNKDLLVLRSPTPGQYADISLIVVRNTPRAHRILRRWSELVAVSSTTPSGAGERRPQEPQQQGLAQEPQQQVALDRLLGARRGWSWPLHILRSSFGAGVDLAAIATSAAARGALWAGSGRYRKDSPKE